MKTLGIYTYQELEQMTVEQLKEYAFMVKPLKDEYTIYAVNTLPYYGVVISVAYGERIIYRDVQLHYHHYENSLQGVKRMLEKAKYSVLSDEELTAPLDEYTDYRNRMNFLNNIAPKKWEYVSMFCIGASSEEEKRFIENAYPCAKIGFCYFKEKEAVEYIEKMLKAVECLHEAAMRRENYFRKAISYELANHEAGYTCRYDDALAGMGILYSKLSPEFQSIVNVELRKQINQIY